MNEIVKLHLHLLQFRMLLFGYLEALVQNALSTEEAVLRVVREAPVAHDEKQGLNLSFWSKANRDELT